MTRFYSYVTTILCFMILTTSFNFVKLVITEKTINLIIKLPFFFHKAKETLTLNFKYFLDTIPSLSSTNFPLLTIKLLVDGAIGGNILALSSVITQRSVALR